ncbi:MAG: hypothetical protein HZA47_03375 [Planctomycetes bacterium]|nr:hypothetical protein [Planctomycetota bacterium]
MKLDDIIKRIEQLIEMGKKVLATCKKEEDYVDWGQQKGFRSAGLSFLERTFGLDHPYVKEFDTYTDNQYMSSIEAGLGILEAAKNEISGGWLFTVKGLVSAEIFADFLDMATYLLQGNYKDPAAVVIGSVLEEHLRQLCNKNNISVEFSQDGKMLHKKADRMNADLSNANVYNKLDHKNVTAWLDLRNKAAHGRYSEYTKDQVGLMLSGVTDFMTRNSV